MARNYDGRDQYQNTPRKVFDKHVDRIELKRKRDREDNRNDLQMMIQKIQHLHQLIIALTHQVEAHIDMHCTQLDGSRENLQRDS